MELGDYYLPLVKEFDRVCRILGIPYSLSSGTLLGAVRHRGYIPWDDDIDVMMVREEYERFLREAPAHLSPHVVIQNYRTELCSVGYFTKLVDSTTFLVELGMSELPITKGVYIDIFPVDRAASRFGVMVMDNIAKRILHALRRSYTLESCFAPSRRYARMFRLLLFPLARLLGLYRINEMDTYIRTRHNSGGREGYTYADYAEIPLFRRPPFPMRIFFEVEEISFEDGKFFAIKEWDQYLERMYGDYWKLPPEDQRRPAHKILELQL